MFSKSGIMAQELKEQLGDRLPIAMRALEASTKKSAKELFKMMEMGQLGADAIVPFVKQFGILAGKGNAVANAIKTVRTQEKLFVNETKQASALIYKSGFSAGLAELYEELTETMRTTGKSQKDLGNIYKNVFKFIAKAMKVITPLIEATIQVVSKLTDALMLSAKGWKMIYEGLPENLRGIAVGVTAIGLAFKSTVAKAAVLISMFQEIASLFDDKLVGALEIQLGSQFNLGKMTQQAIRKDDKTGKYYAQGETKGLLDTDVGKGVALAGGLATLATTVYALQKAIGLFSTATTLAAKVMGVVGGTGTVVPSVDGKDKGKPKSKSKLSRYVTGAYGATIATITSPVTITTAVLAAPVAYTAMKTSDNSENILSSVRSGEAGGRLQNALLRADEANRIRESKLTSSQTPTIKIDGFDISVNLADGNLQQAQQAGEMLGSSFIEKLNSGLSAAIKGGR